MNKVVKKKFRQHLSKIFILIITCFLILKTNFVFASEVFTSNTSTDDVSKTTEEVTNNITAVSYTHLTLPTIRLV